MEAQYDLFKMTRDGYPEWVGAAASLEHARIRLDDLAKSSMESEYFARDFFSGSIVAISNRPPKLQSGVAATGKRVARPTA